MRRTILTFALAVLAAMMIPSDLFGQAQIYTRKEKLKDLTAKTVKVVMTGDEMLDEALKQAVTTSSMSSIDLSAPSPPLTKVSRSMPGSASFLCCPFTTIRK